MARVGRRHLVCPSGCPSQRFELVGGPVFVDSAGTYVSHDDRAASFRCGECQALAIDLVAAARAQAREGRYSAEATLTCPACGTSLLAPETGDESADLECPECAAMFSWDEGRASVLGRFTERPGDDGD
ncbi:MAG: hypothetical protein ACREN7_08055 [Candidatus Dormibacteria bacterium]